MRMLYFLACSLVEACDFRLLVCDNHLGFLGLDECFDVLPKQVLRGD